MTTHHYLQVLKCLYSSMVMTEREHGSTIIIIFTVEKQGDEPDGEVDSNGGPWAIDEDNTCSEASDLKAADTVKPLISSRREVCRCDSD